MKNPVDVKAFRRALGQFPTGVTVITTLDKAGEPIGVTASSFNSVSIDPPLILWSIDKSAYSAPIFEHSSHFSVNVLGKEQVTTSNQFAGRGEEKFTGIAYQSGKSGCPLLENCAAQFECETWNVYQGGDHLIIVGEVVDYRHEESALPLVFCRGSYAIAMQHPSSMKREQLELRENGFLGDYLPYLLHMAFTHSSAQLYPRLMEQCHVTPEEWRVFTLLADYGPIAEEDLAQMVMQPMDIFKATADWMIGKGHIYYFDEHLLALTDTGRALSTELFAIAKEHEIAVLSTLSEQAATELKQSLKAIGGMIN